MYMPDVGNFRASMELVDETTTRIRHPCKLSIPQNGHTPLRKKPTGRNKWMKGFKHIKMQTNSTPQKTAHRKLKVKKLCGFNQ